MPEASRNLLLAVLALAALSLVPLAQASGTAAPPPAGAAEAEAPAEPAKVDTRSEIERFCSNIADAARDRRYAMQTADLESLKLEVDARLKQLEAKRAEYEDWLKRRHDFMKKAEESVVGIYAKMKPDAAAERLAELNPDLAAAILMKVSSRQAGVILNEMNSRQAATLTGIMAAAAQPEDPS